MYKFIAQWLSTMSAAFLVAAFIGDRVFFRLGAYGLVTFALAVWLWQKGGKENGN